jgi:hypothetical protein
MINKQIPDHPFVDLCFGARIEGEEGFRLSPKLPSPEDFEQSTLLAEFPK